MAVKKTATRRPVAVPTTNEEPSKAELQRRMEEAREDISQTVEEIKETVTEQYESVKETVAETLDWRAQFRKHTVAWSLGALAVGYIVGNGIAASIMDATEKKGRGKRSSGLLDEIYSYGESLADEFSEVAQTILLPALGRKVRQKFGIDVSDRLATLGGKLLAARSNQRATKKGASKKSTAKKSGAKKGGAKKSVAKKAAKKSGSKK